MRYAIIWTEPLRSEVTFSLPWMQGYQEPLQCCDPLCNEKHIQQSALGKAEWFYILFSPSAVLLLDDLNASWILGVNRSESEAVNFWECSSCAFRGLLVAAEMFAFRGMQGASLCFRCNVRVRPPSRETPSPRRGWGRLHAVATSSSMWTDRYNRGLRSVRATDECLSNGARQLLFFFLSRIFKCHQFCARPTRCRLRFWLLS